MKWDSALGNLSFWRRSQFVAASVFSVEVSLIKKSGTNTTAVGEMLLKEHTSFVFKKAIPRLNLPAGIAGVVCGGLGSGGAGTAGWLVVPHG